LLDERSLAREADLGRLGDERKEDGE